MAHAGKVISNSAMAGTIKFIKTAADTGGELLEMEATYNTAIGIAAEWGAPEHYHPYQDEHIEVLAGMVSIHIKGQERTYVAGESFDFPRNVPHSFPWGRWVVKKPESFGKYVQRSTVRPFWRQFMDWPRMAK